MLEDKGQHGKLVVRPWTIRTGGGDEIVRAAAIVDALEPMVDRYADDLQVAGIELQFVGDNARTALVLGVVRGAVGAYLCRRGIEVVGVHPSKAKKHATGRGDASKERVQKMVASVYGVADLTDDESDAVAIAGWVLRQRRLPEELRLL